MVYKEEYRDLFSVPEDYYLAHCISADFGMGAGIVVEFNRRFNLKAELQKRYLDYVNKWHHEKMLGDCIPYDRVLNLITKERYFQKPTYQSMQFALHKMAHVVSDLQIKKIAMPIIGCGLDKLNWSRVSKMLQEVFKDTEIEILVCKQ